MPLGFPLAPSFPDFLFSSTEQTKSSKLSPGVPSSSKPLWRLLRWAAGPGSPLPQPQHTFTESEIPPCPTPLPPPPPPDHREFPGGQDPGPDWLGSSSLPCPSVQRFQMCVGWRYLLVFCTEAVPDYCRRGDADNKILLSDLISQPQRLCQRSHSSFGE